jgi:hypothetical protein
VSAHGHGTERRSRNRYMPFDQKSGADIRDPEVDISYLCRHGIAENDGQKLQVEYRRARMKSPPSIDEGNYS